MKRCDLPSFNQAICKRALQYLWIISLMLFFESCWFEARYNHSTPKIDSGEDIRVENGKIFLPEVEIWFLSKNRKGQGVMVSPIPIPVNPSDNFSKPFELILSITPKAGGFSFDPGKLFLSQTSGKKSVLKRIKSGYYSKGSQLLDRIPPSPIREIPLRKDVSTVLTLEFDILPPVPSEPFFVDLAGLSVLGEPYNVPRLRFEQATFEGPLR